jgi:predicted alpha/beta-hydrolase family hydrolase
MNHRFLAGVAAHLAAAGLPVVRFDFPYRTAGRKVPDRMPVLQAALRDVVRDHARGPLVLMGKSMGGRVATMLADELGARGCVVFGYPFHPPDDPANLRTAHLATLRTPTLILQGERDEFGTPAEVATYSLSAAITVQWFADGDHSLVPRRASGCTAAAHFATACAAALAFVRRQIG